MPSTANTVVDIRPRVDALIAQAVAQRASDVHIEPDTDGSYCQMLWMGGIRRQVF